MNKIKDLLAPVHEAKLLPATQIVVHREVAINSVIARCSACNAFVMTLRIHPTLSFC